MRGVLPCVTTPPAAAAADSGCSHSRRSWPPALVWGITTAAGASSSPSPGAGKVILRVGNTQDVDSLNPFIGYSVPAYEVYHLNYDMLTGYKPNGDVAPEIADSWSSTPDFLTWTFKIHPGIKWQDGVALTAKDVAFTYNYIIQNDLSAYSTYTVNMKKAVAVDDTTVKFYLTKPKANILRMWIPIVPEHIWSKISGKAASNSFQNNPPVIGSGRSRRSSTRRAASRAWSPTRTTGRARPRSTRSSSRTTPTRTP